MSDLQRIGKIIYEDKKYHSLYNRGYDCALSFTYVPDFSNESEKTAWLSGFKAGILAKKGKQ